MAARKRRPRRGRVLPKSAEGGSESGHTSGLITCEANALMRSLHNTGKLKHRMPLILGWQVGNQWLFGDTVTTIDH